MRILIVLGVSCLLLAADRTLHAPTSGYQVQYVQGWKVLVNRQLLDEHPQLARETLDLLDNHLFRVRQVLPGKVLSQVIDVPIWVEHELTDGAMCYHPSRTWLKKNGYNPDKARSVEISNAVHFLDWFPQQPWMVLHELAHAYHHQVLGYDHEDLKRAYEQACDGETYDRVLHVNGRRQKHYAMNNVQEYFAEATEAYFGMNDFYPFVKSELKEHDPQLYRVLNQVWNP